MNDNVSTQMAEAVNAEVVEDTKQEKKKNDVKKAEFIQTPENIGDESTPR